MKTSIKKALLLSIVALISLSLVYPSLDTRFNRELRTETSNLLAFEALELDPKCPPRGYWDGTGFNYILTDKKDKPTTVILHPDFTLSGCSEIIPYQIVKMTRGNVTPYMNSSKGNFPAVYGEIPEDAKKKVKQYIKRWLPVAIEEQKKTGIPAYIKLAQGMLESNYGLSHLAKNANNHFGIKCHSRKCKKGHCVNRTDDSHKDFFKVYKSAEDSFRAHSKVLLNTKMTDPKTKKAVRRYRKLFKLDPYDYVAWSDGLKEAGYATSRTYHNKLRRIIKEYNLVEINKQNL